MNVLNEFSKIKEVALRSPLASFIDDEKLSNELNIISESTNNTINRDQAIKELKELKELLDLDLISKEEFDVKSKELKEIILGN